MRSIRLGLVSDLTESTERHHFIGIALNHQLSSRAHEVHVPLLELLLLGADTNSAATTRADDDTRSSQPLKT